jgi:hypothetical protein
MPPHPIPLPVGERGRVRGNFKYFWLDFVYLAIGREEVVPDILKAAGFSSKQ